MAKRGPMMRAGVMIASAAALACGARVALAEDAPANTLVELQRQFSACMAGKPAGPAAGSRLTIMLMMRRDGSIFGKPRITFSHLEGEAEARRRFVDDAERSVEACLPFRITPSLGGAIAGRPFFVSLGRPSGAKDMRPGPRRRRQPQASAIFSRGLSELHRPEGVDLETFITRGSYVFIQQKLACMCHRA